MLFKITFLGDVKTAVRLGIKSVMPFWACGFDFLFNPVYKMTLLSFG